MAIEYMDELGLELIEDNLGGMDYISLGEDEMGGMDYISLGEDDDDDEDEFGKRRRRRRVRRRRPGRRPVRRAARRKPAVVVQKTILAAQTQPGNLGASTITIRPQFDFVAEDLTFAGSTGSTNGIWTITSINFGDRIIFSNATGVPLAVFAAGNFLRGLVKGAAIKAGLDISVNAALGGTAPVALAQLTATFTGLKRGTSGCMP